MKHIVLTQRMDGLSENIHLFHGKHDRIFQQHFYQYKETLEANTTAQHNSNPSFPAHRKPLPTKV
jgi:hypothetical protein